MVSECNRLPSPGALPTAPHRVVLLQRAPDRQAGHQKHRQQEGEAGLGHDEDTEVPRRKSSIMVSIGELIRLIFKVSLSLRFKVSYGELVRLRFKVSCSD